MTYGKTNAIVLRMFNYGEADRVVHFFSEKRGQIHAFARGVRRLKSRIGGRIDLLNMGVLDYNEKSGNQLFFINNFELINTFPSLKIETSSLWRAIFITELVHLVTQLGQPDLQLYKIFTSFLSAIDEKTSKSRTLLLLFQMYLIHHSGYLPPIDYCHNCNQKTSFPISWSPMTDMFWCSRCLPNKNDNFLIITKQMANIMKIMIRPDVKSLASISINDSDLLFAEKFCIKYLSYHLDFNNKTKDILKILSSL